MKLVRQMASEQIKDLFHCKTIHITGGSREFLFLNLNESDTQGVIKVPLDLSDVNEIEWLFAPFSVIREKGVAMLRKTLTDGEIKILEDGSDGEPNLIQVVIESQDTETLQGAFLHQIAITDGAGNTLVPFEGIININRRIQVG